MQPHPLLIAIDGPAASGKGTLGKKIAEHFGLAYLDTGKLYRMVGYKLLHSNYPVEEAENHTSPAAQYAIELARSLNINEIDTLNLEDQGISEAASIVSAIPHVRNALLEFQRTITKSPQGAVLDGRDIGSVVCPEASFKFFITADLETRAKRRYKQLQNQDNKVIYADVLQNLHQRDARDTSRKAAPMQIAADAVQIDTTSLDINDVFAKMVAIIEGTTSSND